VKKIWLYGSRLKRIPPEIGEMEALEYFDPYTSYDLHWLPYEITNCKNLKSSRISTRTLYGNFKNRMGFPNLIHNPIRYLGNTVQCSICGKEMSYGQTNQLWISLWVGSDVMPLLANLCSIECENKLPQPAEDYVQYAHKGGADLKQPLNDWERLEQEMLEMEAEASEQTNASEEVKPENMDENKQAETKPIQYLKLIRKIWER
jgi:hypothetical protein